MCEIQFFITKTVASRFNMVRSILKAVKDRVIAPAFQD